MMVVWNLDVDNKWDAERKAPTEQAAVEKLFPDAREISYDGVDDDGAGGPQYVVFQVVDKYGEHHSVHVMERQGQ